jgi:hypothetical protein
MQGVFQVFSGQRRPTGNETDDQVNLAHIFTALPHELVFFLEPFCLLDFKHGSTVQIVQELINGHTLGGYLAPQYGVPFLHRRDSFGVGRVIHRAGNTGLKLGLGEEAGAGCFRQIKMHPPPVGSGPR